MVVSVLGIAAFVEIGFHWAGSYQDWHQEGRAVVWYKLLKTKEL
jgi:hypothetical protein